MDDVQKVQELESCKWATETGPHEPDELVTITLASKLSEGCVEETGLHKQDELVTITPTRTFTKVRYEEENGPHKPDELVM